MRNESLSLFESSSGDELAEKGAKEVSKHAPPVEVAALDAAILMLARTMPTFTAEDVRAKAGSDWHPNLIGARFLYMSRVANVIEECGFRKSQRLERRGGVLRMWRAKRWA